MTENSTPDIATITAGDIRPSVAIEAVLEDRRSTQALRRTLFGIVALVLALIVWSVVSQVDELSRARGELRPAGNVQSLQSQEGGTILKVHVQEGDIVSAGDVVVDFIVTDIEKLAVQLEVRMASLMIDREQMLSVLEDRQPDFSDFSGKYPELVANARTTYSERLASRNAAEAAKRIDVAQLTTTLEGARDATRLIGRELVEAKNRLDRLEAGAKKGVIPLLRVSEVRQRYIALEERLSESKSRAESTAQAIERARQELTQVKAEYNEQLSTELSKVTEQLAELEAERQALEQRQGRIQLNSTVDGIVMDLPDTTEGAVIPPGGTVARIVPIDQEVVMEVMVSPRDIGFIRVGQRATVKIDSFDSARFGAVEGRVEKIAPTSSKMPETGQPFYKVNVVLSTPYVGSPDRRLIPGMTGEADIATGTKSVMQYLLKPIFLASDTAFHER